MNSKLFLVMVTALLAFTRVSAQTECLIAPIPLNQRIQQAELIIEGRVVSQQSYWGTGHRNIFTRNRVEVYKVFKGTTMTATVDVITEGGTVGMERQVFSSTLSLNEGAMGIFTLIQSPFTEAGQGYAVYSGLLGFISYDAGEGNARDPFETYPSIVKNLYPAIRRYTNTEFRQVAPNPYLNKPVGNQKTGNASQGTLSVPVINSFTPTSVAAGTGSTVTITGSNFQAAQGTGYVELKSANDGGSTWRKVLDSDIISWSDAQIVIRVSGVTQASASDISGGASSGPPPGTGQIRITNSTASSNQATSSGTLTITYSHSGTLYNGSAYYGIHRNHNGSGGYTFVSHSSVPTLANTYFSTILNQWSCVSGINWNLSGTTTISTAGSDNSNVITFYAFAATSTAFARCVTYLSGCSDGTTAYWYVKEIDMEYNTSYSSNFYYGTGTPSGTQYDFHTISLHEMGHGHQLGHVINTSDVMHYSLGAGDVKRTFNTNNTTGAQYMMTYALTPTVYCNGVTIMTTSIPSAPTSGGNQSVCSTGYPASISATPGTGSVVDWYSASTGGTLLSSGSNTYSASAAGTYYAQARNSTSGCTSASRTAVTVSTLTSPAAPTSGGNVSACASAFPATLTATAPSGSVTDWYSASTGGTLLASVSNTYSAASAGTYYAQSRTTANSCISTSRTAITLTSIAAPAAPTSGGNTTACTYPVTLTATAPSGSVTDWYSASTGGTLLSSGSNTYSASAAGTYYAQSRTSTGSCTSASRTAVTVSTTTVPAAPFSSGDVTACASALPGTLTATPPSGSVVDWYSAPTGGTLLASGSNTYSTSTAGTYFAQSRVSSGTCTSMTRTGVTMVISPSPTAPFSSGNVTVCSNSLPASLSVTVVSGSVVDWYSAASGGTLLQSSSTSYSAPAAGTYYAQSRSMTTGCVNTSRTAVTLTVNTQPAAPTSGGNVTFCAAGLPATLTATAPSGSVVDWYSASTGGNLLQAGSSTYSTSAAGTYYAQSRSSASSCSSAVRTPVTLTVSTDTLALTASSNGPVCAGNSITLTASGATTYSWTGPNNYTGMGQSVTITNATTAMAGAYTVTGTSNGCTGTASVTVVVNSLPTATVTSLTGSSTDCTTGSITLTANAGTGYTYQWYTNNIFNGNTAITQTADYANFYYVVVTSNGCSTTSSTFSTSFAGVPAPTATLSASGATSFCSGSSVTLSASSTQGNALQLTAASSQYVNQTTSITELGKADFTIEAMIKTTGVSSGIVVCQDGDLFWESGEKAFYLNSAGRPTFVGYGNDYINSTLAVNDGNWHHVAVTWDYSGSGTTGTAKIYVDGVDRTGTVGYAANNNNTGTFKIGAPNYGSNEAPNFFNGSIDEVRIWGVVRTQAQLQANLYKAIDPGSYPSLKAYYQFDEASGNATDNAEFGWNYLPGTLVNSPVRVASTAMSAGNTYLWSNGATTSSISASTSGSYYVTVTSASGCATSSAGQTVTVNSVTAAATATTPCAGGTLNLTASGGTSYAWTGPNGFTSTAQNPSRTSATTTMSGTYTVTVTDANGCSGTATVTALVNPVPVATITASGATALCPGNSVTLTAAGTEGSALSFDGTDDYVTSAISAFNHSAYTIEAWIKPASLANLNQNLIVITTSSGSMVNWTHQLRISGGKFQHYLYDGTVRTVTGSTTLVAGQWYHVAGVATSNGAMRLYVNGVEEGTSITIGTLGNAGDRFLLGGSSNGMNYFNGSMDEVRVFTSVLTQAQIQAWMNKAVSASHPAYASLNRYYQFNDGTGTTASDSRGSYPATLSNSPTWTASTALNAGTTYLWNNGATTSSITVSTTGTFNCAVTSASGCSSAGSNSISVNALPAPTATASANTPCVGSTLNLTASGGFSYAWTGPNGFASSVQNPVRSNATLAMAGDYTVTVSDAGGCTASATISVAINEMPVAAASAGTACAGGTLNLTASGGTSYSWAGPNGFTSTVQNPTLSNVTAAMAGTYIVTVSNSNGCSATAQATATINPAPTATITASGPTSICSGSSVTLTAPVNYALNLNGSQEVTIPANPLYDFADGTLELWARPNWTDSMLAYNPCLIANRGSSTRWSYHMRKDYSGIDLYNGNSVTFFSYAFTRGEWYHLAMVESDTLVKVYVNGVQAGTPKQAGSGTGSGMNLYIGSSSGGNELFIGDIDEVRVWNTVRTAAQIAANYDAEISGSTTGLVGYWQFNEGTGNSVADASATASSGVISNGALWINSGLPFGNTYLWNTGETTAAITATTAGSYSVAVTNEHGCTSTSTATQVTVNPLPTFTASANSPCIGGNLNLTADSGASYFWTGPNGFTSTDQNPVLMNAADSLAGNYTITVTNASGCSVMDTISVVIQALPAAPVVVASPTTLSLGSYTTLSVTSPVSGQTYTWSGMGLSAATGTSVTATPTATGTATYSVTTSTMSGCTSAAGSVSVQVNAASTGSINTSALATSTFCQGSTIPVSFSITDITFNTGNVFTAQLSDAAGSFASPVSIGTRTATTAGTITATLPASALGAGYRIRVISSSPAYTGTDNGSNLTVLEAPLTPTTPYTYLCNTSSGSATLTGTGGGTDVTTYKWYNSATAVTPLATGLAYTTPVLNASKIYYMGAVNSNGCESATRKAVYVYLVPAYSVLFSPAAPTFEVGGSVSITASTNTSGTTTYKWSPATGLNSTTTATVIANPAVTTTYTVTATKNSCITSATITVTVTCANALSGNYTINKAAAASATNFTSVKTFADRLMNCGVSGPVTASIVAGSGPYTEQIELGQITGASAVNTITINGNGNVLQFKPSEAANYVLRLNGTDYLRLQNLTVTASSSTLGWGIHLYNSAEYNVISGCTVNVSAVISGLSVNGIVASASTSSNNTAGATITNLQLLNNVINGGYYGISLCGLSTAKAPGIVISGNTISNAYFAGIYLLNLNAPLVSANYLPLRNGSVSGYGMYLSSVSNSFVVERNQITGFGRFGLYLLDCNSQSGTGRAQVSNNMVGGLVRNLTSSTFGIILVNADRIDLWHNSVNLDKGAANSIACQLVSSSSGVDALNNSFAYTGTAAAYAFYAPTGSLSALDYNNYYSTGSKFVNLGGDKADLAALQATASPVGHDVHSYQGDPMYVSTSNLHVQPASTQLAGRGVVIAGITTDLDGQARSTAPYIGADEYVVPSRMEAMAANGAFSAEAYPNPFGGQITIKLSSNSKERVQLSLTDVLGRVIEQRAVEAFEEYTFPTATIKSGVYLMTIQQGSETRLIRVVKEQ